MSQLEGASAKKVAKEEGRQEKSIEIAKKMKSKNMSIEEIIELTGLTKEQIESIAEN